MCSIYPTRIADVSLEKLPLLNDNMPRKSYLQQAMLSEHLLDGIHKLDEPVSNMTLKFCGGVPTVISPKYWACEIK